MTILVRHAFWAVALAVPAFVFVPSLEAQIEAQASPPVVIFDGPTACLSPEQVAGLTGVIRTGEPGTAVDRRRPLDTVVEAYRCMLDARGPQTATSGFRSDFIETLHGLYDGRDLCLLDRLTGALVTMRDVANRNRSTPRDVLSQREIQWVYAALSNARSSVERASEIHTRFSEDPFDPMLLRLARTSCVEPSDPVPAEVYFRELVDASVALGKHHSEVGRDAGAVLSSTLNGAKSMMGWEEEEDPYQNPSPLFRDWSVLVSIDEGNLSSTGLFLDVVRELEELERSRAIDPGRITPGTARDGLDRMRQTLRSASDKLIRSEEAWRYYDHYSDALFSFADAYALRRDPDLYRMLVDEAGQAAWEGFERVAGLAVEDAVRAAQQKLMDRVVSYGLEFAERLDYKSLVEFESQFVDLSGRIVPGEFQCAVNAHLAQAYYVLGVRFPDASRKYPNHLEESCRLVSAGDLETLRVAVQERVR